MNERTEWRPGGKDYPEHARWRRPGTDIAAF